MKAQYPLILNLCQKRTGHAEEATDVAQASISKFLKEIYIYVRGRGPASVKYPAWHKFRNPEAWLTRIVMNTLKDFFKRNRAGSKTALTSTNYSFQRPVSTGMPLNEM